MRQQRVQLLARPLLALHRLRVLGVCGCLAAARAARLHCRLRCAVPVLARCCVLAVVVLATEQPAEQLDSSAQQHAAPSSTSELSRCGVACSVAGAPCCCVLALTRASASGSLLARAKPSAQQRAAQRHLQGSERAVCDVIQRVGAQRCWRVRAAVCWLSCCHAGSCPLSNMPAAHGSTHCSFRQRAYLGSRCCAALLAR